MQCGEQIPALVPGVTLVTPNGVSDAVQGAEVVYYHGSLEHTS